MACTVAAKAEWRNILNSSQLNHGPQLSHPPLMDQSEALPVLVDDDALAVLGVEAAGHPHVQFEARARHVHLIINKLITVINYVIIFVVVVIMLTIVPPNMCPFSGAKVSGRLVPTAKTQ